MRNERLQFLWLMLAPILLGCAVAFIIIYLVLPTPERPMPAGMQWMDWGGWNFVVSPVALLIGAWQGWQARTYKARSDDIRRRLGIGGEP